MSLTLNETIQNVHKTLQARTTNIPNIEGYCMQNNQLPTKNHIELEDKLEDNSDISSKVIVTEMTWAWKLESINCYQKFLTKNINLHS